MFHRIMVGTNGSDESHDALALSERLAALTGAEVVVVHTYPAAPLEGGIVLGVAGAPLRDAARDLLAAELEHGPAGARVLAVPSTSPARGLHDAAAAEGADLLVVGSSRHGAVGRALLGDDARQVVHHAPCAVVVAPRGYREHGAERLATIGVGFDDAPDSHRALAAARELATAADASLRLITAIAAPFQGASTIAYPYPVDWSGYYEAAERRLREATDRILADLPATATRVVEHGPAADVLTARSEDCDLLVVGSRHWGAVHRLLMGSTSTALIGRVRCPLLIVPRADDAES